MLLAAASLALIGGCPTSNSGDSSAATNRDSQQNSPGASGSTDVLGEQFAGCDIPADAESWRATILLLVNQERSRRGLNTLAYSEALEAQAEQYACEMISYDFFAHENPVTGSTLPDRALEFGYDYQIIGENLAAGQPTPDRAMDDWMNSPGHAANILQPSFVELGIGIRTGGEYGVYWVQEFGRRRESARILVSPRRSP